MNYQFQQDKKTEEQYLVELIKKFVASFFSPVCKLIINSIFKDGCILLQKDSENKFNEEYLKKYNLHNFYNQVSESIKKLKDANIIMTDTKGNIYMGLHDNCFEVIKVTLVKINEQIEKFFEEKKGDYICLSHDPYKTFKFIDLYHDFGDDKSKFVCSCGKILTKNEQDEIKKQKWINVQNIVNELKQIESNIHQQTKIPSEYLHSAHENLQNTEDDIFQSKTLDQYYQEFKLRNQDYFQEQQQLLEKKQQQQLPEKKQQQLLEKKQQQLLEKKQEQDLKGQMLDFEKKFIQDVKNLVARKQENFSKFDSLFQHIPNQADKDGKYAEFEQVLKNRKHNQQEQR